MPLVTKRELQSQPYSKAAVRAKGLSVLSNTPPNHEWSGPVL